MEEVWGGDLVLGRISAWALVLVRMLEGGLVMAGRMLEERGMKSQMGYWDPHL